MDSPGWNSTITAQMDFWWSYMFRARLEGLTTDEYLREPVPGCWSIRTGIDGRLTLEGGAEPEPPPVTTIAWRMGHLASGLARRSAYQFDRSTDDLDSYAYAATADEAVAQLDAEYATWRAGIERVGDEGLMRACGPTEGPFAEAPLVDLVLHVYRELLCHGAEVCLLRDLYRAR